MQTCPCGPTHTHALVSNFEYRYIRPFTKLIRHTSYILAFYLLAILSIANFRWYSRVSVSCIPVCPTVPTQLIQTKLYLLRKTVLAGICAVSVTWSTPTWWLLTSSPIQSGSSPTPFRWAVRNVLLDNHISHVRPTVGGGGGWGGVATNIV